MNIPPLDVQMPVLRLGVQDLQPEEEFARRLQRSFDTQTPLIIKAGFDPTAADLHLGHTVLLEKMAQFQRFGHRVMFLVGDYTALIGDPTGRNSLRPPLSTAQIQSNAATYTQQCFKILDPNQTTIVYNSSWLGKLSFNDVIVLASKYNLGRMLERRDFKQRFLNNQSIALHELLYPLMQAYDSVVLQADVELGGFDQIFNLNVGRDLMVAYGKPPQVVMTVDLLLGVDGQDKMSKSKGNHIGILEAPKQIFGKTMRISDQTLWQWLPLLGGSEPTEAQRDAPLATKKAMARWLVEKYCGSQIAAETAAWWEAGRAPQALPSFTMPSNLLSKIVCAAGAANSGREARQKIIQGAVRLDEQKWIDPQATVPPGHYLLKVGKLWAAQLTITAANPAPLS